MDRYYSKSIQRYQYKKISLISGPRQSGKTTLSKLLCKKNDYLNYDREEDRQQLLEKSWNRSADQIIFDEIHKMTNWKSWLKGVYDTEKIPPALTVTGSARLDTHRKVGDSMAGRYFHYRLHPLDIVELSKLQKNVNINQSTQKLLEYGGFPEPFLEGNDAFYARWKKTHLDIILRQDLIDLESVKNIKSIEILIQLLKRRVGSPISYTSLSEDLNVSDKTVKKWLEILENLYVIFKVTPFHKNIARAHKKKPKYYFFDTAQVESSEGARLENLVACSLYKHIQFQEDCLGKEQQLCYLAKNGGGEIDFALIEKNQITHAIEVKYSDDSLSKSFQRFKKELPKTKFIQLVLKLKKEKTFPSGEEIRQIAPWLCQNLLYI